MKPNLLSLFLLLVIRSTVLAQDLPNPPANLQSLPVGSYLIPMDNSYQLNASSLFNLKAYGLIVYLLNNGVKVKWAIKSGKAKDGIDFTATVQQVKPSSLPGSSPASFKAGPFVIYATDLGGVDALIDAYYISASLSGANRPKVFQTIAAVTVDIRYNLTGFLPKAGILTDGGNQSIHSAFMVAAGIPTSNYTTSTGSNLISGCFTFASEPHNSKTGAAVDAAISNIKNFVLAGGNFLAECAAVSNYENNTLGRFQTTTGISVTNTNIGTSITYANADLSYSQFEGAFNGSLTGSLENWQINAAGTNNEHNHATGTAANIASISASVSKLKAGLGGLVFYLGNHNYTASDVQNINGIRMYMNAFLTPSLMVCGTLLPLKLTAFTGIVQQEKAKLQWSVTDNETGKGFQVERSDDGINFVNSNYVAANNTAGSASYSFSVPFSSAVAYFRIKLIGENDYVSYSQTILLKNEVVNASDNMVILQNPVGATLSFKYQSLTAGPKTLSIFNALGTTILQKNLIAEKGSNLYSISLQNLPATGICFLTLGDERGYISKKFIKE